MSLRKLPHSYLLVTYLYPRGVKSSFVIVYDKSTDTVGSVWWQPMYKLLQGPAWTM